MKTLVMFEEVGNQVFFFELNGDQTRFHEVFIGDHDTNTQKLQKELESIVYKPKSGEYLVKKLSEPTRDWDFFVHAGYLP
jgi:hypothetical protein